jgi:pantothenate kinase
MAFTKENAAQLGALGGSKRGPSRMTKMLNMVRESQTEEDVQQVFDTLKDLAKGGDMDAIKTYFAYIIGKPTEKIELESSGAGIMLNIVRQDGNRQIEH